MSDDRDTPDEADGAEGSGALGTGAQGSGAKGDGLEGDGTEGDGLDAWFAANFPPKNPDPAPPADDAVPPAGQSDFPAHHSAPPPISEPPSWVPKDAQPVVPPAFPPASSAADSDQPGDAPFDPPTAPSFEVEPPTEPPTEPPGMPPAVPPGMPPVVSPTEPPGMPPVEPPVVPPTVPPITGELSGRPPEPVVPADSTVAFGGQGEASALDHLFGESKFRDYEAEPATSENPFAKSMADQGSPVDASAGKPKSAGVTTTQKVLLWVAGSLLAALALLALFVLGTRLPDFLGPAPAVVTTPSNTPTPTPTSTALPLGPVEPGDYRWDELLGGECIDPYVGPWAQRFTVVDCANPHPAQLVVRGVFGEDDGFSTPYPGVEALQEQVAPLCTANAVVDYSAAAAHSDIQFEASFAATQDDWVDGDRDYYCFMSRSSGGPITGSIAVPQVAPTPSESPAP